MKTSHRDIINDLGIDIVAHATGKSRAAVASWRDRDNIPARYWIDIVGLCETSRDYVLRELAIWAKEKK